MEDGTVPAYVNVVKEVPVARNTCTPPAEKVAIKSAWLSALNLPKNRYFLKKSIQNQIENNTNQHRDLKQLNQY